MSGAGASGSVRVSIPQTVRKMIQNIKEITGNHSEDEIYAMLKECSMDPNETTQKLLLQDPFHEVKRKRDRKKENANNKESGDSRWRPGAQGRGNRSGRPNFPSRSISHDAGAGRNSAAGRDNGNSQSADKGAGSSLSSSQEKTKEASPSASSAAVMANGPTVTASGNASVMHTPNLPAESGLNQQELSSSAVNSNKIPPIAFGTGQSYGEPFLSSSNSSVSVTPASSSTVCFSSSDPVLMPSNDSRLPGAVGKIKREVGGHRTGGESNVVISAEKSASEIGTSFIQGKMPNNCNKSQGIVKGQLTEPSQASSVSVHGGSPGSRPSSNYSSRSQQLTGPQKGSNKEWKPKQTNTNVPLGHGMTGSSDVNLAVEASVQPRPVSNALDSEEETSKLQKKLEELHLPRRQHVIIPNHIHVPDSERTKLSFGSFDADFGVTSTYVSGPESEKSSTPLSETSQAIEEAVNEQAASNHSTSVTDEEGTYPDQPQSPSNVPGNVSGVANVSSNVVPDYTESKQETANLPGPNQYSVVHTSPNYSFGFVPPMVGSQIASFESTDSQARDVSRLPSFVVPQPFDPTSYYAQFYRSGPDSDGRISPFPSTGVATKFNGNVAVLAPHTSPPPQEGGNPLVLSTAGLTPLAMQAAGLMQSSLSVTQQPLPVFRPPAGLHISHYPPNYIPYGPYFSPIYVPPPGIHQFLSNGVFPQQPQAGGVYPTPQAAAATGVKYSLPQYKPGTNTGNSTHIGMPSGYGPYGSSPAGYNPSSAATGGNSTANEDLGASQFKENNVYITGQQSEGSAVWFTAPGRDISSLPASSFYNLPPQGQHVTFATTQTGHGGFASIYHPAQPVSAAGVHHPLLQQSQGMVGGVDMVGPTGSVYQQPQHQQINWPSNY